MTLRRLVPVVALVAVAGIVAAGCGSGDASSSQSTKSSPATRNAPTTTAPPPATSTSTAGSSTLGEDLSPGRHVLAFDVNGLRRTAVIVVPERATDPAPLVFVFHGHGGSGAQIEGRFAIETRWPEAIVVYPDGLPGHQGITDANGTKPGWQTAPGESGDRDIALFDTLLSTIRAKLRVDDGRVYVMGHSNGSAFTSLLLNQRGSEIAATANMSAQPGPFLLANDPVRSMFMAMGTNDPLVPYARQRQSIPLVEQKLGVDTANAITDGYLRIEHGPDDIELDVYVYPGGHAPPLEVADLIVQFFQRHTLPAV